MLIYRVEDKSHDGLHRGGYYNLYCDYLSLDKYNVKKIPPPQDEPHMGFRSWFGSQYGAGLGEDIRFGFESIEMLRRWIPSKRGRAYIQEHGAMLMVYQTLPQYCKIGTTQLVFRLSKSQPLHRLCLADTKTLLFTLS